MTVDGALPHLLLEGVGQRYRTEAGETEALAPTSLSIDEGELVVLVGSSGCGKTTLLRMIAGLLEPTSGRVLERGRPVLGPGADRGFVFQQPALYPWLSVTGNVELGLRFRKVPRRQRAERAAQLLDLVGLAEAAGARPYELSGGMQQRCQLARVLATEPSVLLLDEPFAALDAITRERLQGELRTMWRTRGSTIVFVTHAVDEAAVLGTRAVVMAAGPGRVIADVPLPGADLPTDQRRIDPAVVAAAGELRRLLADGQAEAGVREGVGGPRR